MKVGKLRLQISKSKVKFKQKKAINYCKNGEPQTKVEQRVKINVNWMKKLN